MKLTDLKCRHAKTAAKPYKITDGAGLHLLIAPTGNKYWRMLYSYGGKNKCLALGVYPEVALLEARERTLDARRQLTHSAFTAIRLPVSICDETDCRIKT